MLFGKPIDNELKSRVRKDIISFNETLQLCVNYFILTNANQYLHNKLCLHNWGML